MNDSNTTGSGNQWTYQDILKPNQTGVGQTTGTITTYPPYQPPAVCPGCGRCNHCGRGGQWTQPQWTTPLYW